MVDTCNKAPMPQDANEAVLQFKSTFTLLQIIPNRNVLLSSVEHKRKCFKTVLVVPFQSVTPSHVG